MGFGGESKCLLKGRCAGALSTDTQGRQRTTSKVAKGYGFTTAPAGLTSEPGRSVSEDPFVIFNPLWAPAISFGTRPASGSPQQHTSGLDP